MPYGTVSDDVRAHLEFRANAAGIRIELEAKETDCAHDGDCDCNYAPDYAEVSIICTGALDEYFGIRTNGSLQEIAKWVAEYLEANGVTDYWVMLSHANGDLLAETKREDYPES